MGPKESRTTTIAAQNILVTRSRALSRRGLRETSLSDIAGAAGLDRVSFYYYFQNKEAILAEVLQFALAESTASLRRIAEDDEARTKSCAA